MHEFSLHSKDVPQGSIVVRGGEKVCLLWMDGEYVQRHGCRYLAENKIRIEDIFHDKGCAQGKAGQDPTCLSLSIALFCQLCYTKVKRGLL